MSKLKRFLLITLVLMIALTLSWALMYIGGIIGYLIAGRIGQFIGQIMMVSIGMGAYMIVRN